jgi:hypothetical protein
LLVSGEPCVTGFNCVSNTCLPTGKCQ